MINKLQVITLLDSLCFGLTYPFLSTYIRSLGADHVIVGLLSVGYLLCNLISKTIEVPLTKSLGNKFCFIITLIIISISHFYLLRTSNYWIVIFSRCIHGAVVSHSQNLCKDILIQHVEDTRKEYALTVFNVLSGCGYIVGPILAGYLFSIKFVYISFLAFILSFINLCLAITVPNQDDVCTTTEDIEDSLSEKVCQNINDLATSFAKSDYRRNWDIMAMRFLHVSCVTIFFGKFSQILDYNFKASPVTLGYAYAYLNALTFASTHFISIVKTRYSQLSSVELTDYAFKSLGVALFVAFYIPLYVIYLVACIPVVFLSSFINSIWKDLFTARGNESLNKLNDPLKVAAGMTTPLLFGVLCNAVGHHAVIAFSLVPTILSSCVLTLHTKYRNIPQTKGRKNQ